MLNKTYKYGILAVVFLAKENYDGYLPISTISKEINISFHYLTKIYQLLSKYGIVESQKGSGGGIKIAKDPSSIYLSNIIEAMNSNYVNNEDDKYVNGLINVINHILDKNTTRHVNEYLEKTNIDDLLKDIFLD